MTASPEVEAERLIACHGSLAAVLLEADPRNDTDRVSRHLATIQAAMVAALRQRILDKPIIGTAAVAADYLMLEMGHLPVEHVRVLFLNTRNRIVADETVMRGTLDCAPVFPREIIRRALFHGAASLILAHNHPSGEATPSRQDIAVTHQLIDGGQALGIGVLDHLILSASGWISLRAEGLI